MSQGALGGVGICVKSNMMTAYQIELIDEAIEGIIGLLFEHRESDYCFAVFSFSSRTVHMAWRYIFLLQSSVNSSIPTVYIEADAVYICVDLLTVALGG